MKLKIKKGDKVRFKKTALSTVTYSKGLTGKVIDNCFYSGPEKFKSKYILIQMKGMPKGYLTPMIYDQVDEYLEKT